MNQLENPLDELSPLDQELIENVSSNEMSAMQAMWARVNLEASKLDPKAARIDDEIRKTNPKHRHGFMEVSRVVVWVTSKKTPIKGIRGGRVFQVPPLLAAQLIVLETHRLATDVEIKAWEGEQTQRRDEAARLAALKNPAPPTPQVHVSISPETLAAAVRDQARNRPQEAKQEQK